jgi:hypothetical protein
MPATLHDVVVDALEYDFDCGITADCELDPILARIRKIFAPDMSPLAFDLLVADLRRDAENDLRRYALGDPKATAAVVVEALLEHAEESRNKTRRERIKS